MEVKLFGPRYDAIAPEVIRAFWRDSIYCQLYFCWVFLIFNNVYHCKRKKTSKNHKRKWKSTNYIQGFQRLVILLNIVIMIYLFITGFSITFGNWTGGGYITKTYETTHEIVGLGLDSCMRAVADYINCFKKIIVFL